MSSKKDLRVRKEKNESIYQIIEKVRDYWPDFMIHESDLKKPSTNFVQKFYSRFFEEYEKVICETRRDILKQDVVWIKSKNIEDIRLIIELRKIAKQLDLSPFGLNDLFEPQPTRTGYFITWFINYLVFLKSDEDYKDELKERAEKAEFSQKLKDKKQVLLEELKEKNVAIGLLETSVKKEKEKIEGLSAEHQQVLEENTARELKQQEFIMYLKKLVSDVEASASLISNLREELMKLQEQLVEEEEVDKLKNEIGNLKSKIVEIAANRSTMIDNFEEHESKTKHYDECLQLIRKPEFGTDLDKMIISLQEWIDQLKNIQMRKQELSEKEIEVDSLKKDIPTYNDSIDQLKEKFNQLSADKDTMSGQFEQVCHLLNKEIKQNIELARLSKDDRIEIEKEIGTKLEDIATLKIGVNAHYERVLKDQTEALDVFNNILIKLSKKMRKLQLNGDSSDRIISL